MWIDSDPIGTNTLSGVVKTRNTNFEGLPWFAQSCSMSASRFRLMRLTLH